MPAVAAAGRSPSTPAAPTIGHAPCSGGRRASSPSARSSRRSSAIAPRHAINCARRAALDPTNPDLAYQLARAQEAVGATDDAAAAYCRFSRSPRTRRKRPRRASGSPRLTRSAQPALPSEILAPVPRGDTAYDAGRYARGGARVQQRDRAAARLGRRVLRPRAHEDRSWAARAGDRGSAAVPAAPPGSRGSTGGDRAHERPARRDALADRGAGARSRHPGRRADVHGPEACSACSRSPRPEARSPTR